MTQKIYLVLKRLSQHKNVLLIIFFGTLITRGIGIYFGGGRGDDEDGAYLVMAVNFLKGEGFYMIDNPFGRVYSWLPIGMSILYVPFTYLFGTNPTPVRIFFLLFSASANVLLFLIGKKLFSPVCALVACLVWIFYPPQWLWGSRINPINYATNMMVVCVFLLFWAWEKKSAWGHFLVGILWGTISITRGEFVFGFVPLCLATFFYFHKEKIGIRNALLIFLGCSLVFLPLILRNYRLHHRFILIATNDGYNFWKAYNPRYNFSGNDIPYTPELLERLRNETNEVARANILKHDAFVFLKENPMRAMRNIVGNLLNYLRPWLSFQAIPLKQNILYMISYVPVLFLFLYGLFFIPWKNPGWIAVMGLFLYKWVIHAPFYVVVRFREAIFPLMALVVALGLKHVYEKMNRSLHE